MGWTWLDAGLALWGGRGLRGRWGMATLDSMTLDAVQAAAILTALPEGLVLGELLGFPEAAVVAGDADGALETLRGLGMELAKRDRALGLAGRATVGTPRRERVEVTLTPTRGTEGWDQPLPLSLALVVWEQTPRHAVGYLPALKLAVAGRSVDAVRERAAAAARRVAVRSGATRDLRWWAARRRLSGVSLGSVDLETPRRTALARAKAAEEAAEAEGRDEPVVQQVTTDLTAGAGPGAGAGAEGEPAFGVDAALRALADLLRERPSQPARSVLLVGPSGVGKTAVTRELARRRGAFGLEGTAFWATDGSRLVAGMTGFGEWQERCAKLAAEAKRSGAVLALGNLVELMQAGRYEGNALGIASFLKPMIARGDFQAIAEATEEQRQLVEREDPGLLEVFEALKVDPPEAPRRRVILRAVAGDAVAEEALDQLDALHERFATYSVAPGRPVGFLRRLLKEHATPSASDVTGAFARETGLPRFMIDPGVAFDPAACRDALTAEVIGQPAAVQRVADALTVVKADLSRPERPIASFLFAGPTGVGKTQLARATAGYLFGDPARMTRFDMSEYGSPAAVARLMGGSGGGGGGGGEGLLTAKVREQPFAVVLFDEFEKAHPDFFDLLLQVLGEGRLTDGAGRVADFTQCVIVMTSNLGAGSAGGPGFGFTPASKPAGAPDAAYVEAARDALRPELFNRIDRVVPFAALGRYAVRAIVTRELERVAERDGLKRRGVRLEVAPAAADLLAMGGFDAELGARPLQRAIDRRVLAPLADALNGYGVDTPLAAAVGVKGGEIAVSVRAVPDAGRSAAERSDRAALEAVVADRRRARRLAGCSAVLAIENEAERLRREKARRERDQRTDAWTDPRMHELPRLEALADRVARTRQALEDAEDALAEAFYGDGAGDAAAAAAARASFEELLLDVHGRGFASPDEALLGLYGPWRPLAPVYLSVAAEHGAEVAAAPLFVWDVGREPEPDGGAAVRAHGAPADERVPERWAHGDRVVWRGAETPLRTGGTPRPRPNTFGFLLRFRGPRVATLLAGEAGRHLFKAGQKAAACYVEAADGPWSAYAPPPGAEDVLGSEPGEDAPVRRVYDAGRGTLDDRKLGRRVAWEPDRTASVLPRLVLDERDRAIEEMLGA